MYFDFFSLREAPFHITPNPDFLYLSPSHREALATIIYGVEQGKGFIALIGEVGLGKTTLLKAFMKAREGSREKIIYLFNSRISSDQLLQTLAREMDLDAQGLAPQELHEPIYQALIDEYAQGNRVVLLVDEAQAMPDETLEGLRLISNLETNDDKLIQIVLVGQPELASRLERHELRQLKQRIAVRATLAPLNRQESLAYIQYRCKQTGGRAENIFSLRALAKIAKQANGLPRAINILCDNALITSFGYGQKPVSLKVVNEVIADLSGKKRRFLSRVLPRLAGASFAAICLLLIGLGFFSYFAPEEAAKLKSTALSLLNMPATEKTTLAEQTPPPIINPARQIPPDTASDEVIEAEPHQPTETEPSAIEVLEEDPPNELKETLSPKLERAQELPSNVDAVAEVPAVAREFIPPPQSVEPQSVLLTKTVREGDTRYDLARDIYGDSNPTLWEYVRKNNPQIKENYLIKIGEIIVFPDWQHSAIGGNDPVSQR